MPNPLEFVTSRYDLPCPPTLPNLYVSCNNRPTDAQANAQTATVSNLYVSSNNRPADVQANAQTATVSNRSVSSNVVSLLTLDRLSLPCLALLKVCEPVRLLERDRRAQFPLVELQQLQRANPSWRRPT